MEEAEAMREGDVVIPVNCEVLGVLDTPHDPVAFEEDGFWES